MSAEPQSRSAGGRGPRATLLCAGLLLMALFPSAASAQSASSTLFTDCDFEARHFPNDDAAVSTRAIPGVRALRAAGTLSNAELREHFVSAQWHPLCRAHSVRMAYSATHGALGEPPMQDGRALSLGRFAGYDGLAGYGDLPVRVFSAPEGDNDVKALYLVLQLNAHGSRTRIVNNPVRSDHHNVQRHANLWDAQGTAAAVEPAGNADGRASGHFSTGGDIEHYFPYRHTEAPDGEVTFVAGDDLTPVADNIQDVYRERLRLMREDNLLVVARYHDDASDEEVAAGRLTRHADSLGCRGPDEVEAACVWAPAVGAWTGGGSDFAAPVVAGALAALLAAYPDATGRELIRAAKACTRPVAALPGGLGVVNFEPLIGDDGDGPRLRASDIDGAITLCAEVRAAAVASSTPLGTDTAASSTPMTTPPTTTTFAGCGFSAGDSPADNRRFGTHAIPGARALRAAGSLANAELRARFVATEWGNLCSPHAITVGYSATHGALGETPTQDGSDVSLGGYAGYDDIAGYDSELVQVFGTHLLLNREQQSLNLMRQVVRHAPGVRVVNNSARTDDINLQSSLGQSGIPGNFLDEVAVVEAAGNAGSHSSGHFDAGGDNEYYFPYRHEATPDGEVTWTTRAGEAVSDSAQQAYRERLRLMREHNLLLVARYNDNASDEEVAAGNLTRHESSLGCRGPAAVEAACVWAPAIGDWTGGGTSFSAPVMAGAVAALLAAYPDATGRELVRATKACTRPVAALPGGLGVVNFEPLVGDDGNGPRLRANNIEGAISLCAEVRAEAVASSTPLFIPDINRDGQLDADDALILYYAYALRSVLGSGR